MYISNKKLVSKANGMKSWGSIKHFSDQLYSSEAGQHVAKHTHAHTQTFKREKTVLTKITFKEENFEDLI